MRNFRNDDPRAQVASRRLTARGLAAFLLLLAALVPRLGPTGSPALQGLPNRLLLSNAVAPGPRPADGMAGGTAGDESADLVDLRLERLIDAGQVESANTVLGLVPARGD